MSIMLVLLGIFGKLTGAIATLPDPVVGGVAMLSLGLVISVGISQLHAVDLEATRNQMALGMALLLGIMIPSYLQSNPGMINTGMKWYLCINNEKKCIKKNSFSCLSFI